MRRWGQVRGTVPDAEKLEQPDPALNCKEPVTICMVYRPGRFYNRDNITRYISHIVGRIEANLKTRFKPRPNYVLICAEDLEPVDGKFWEIGGARVHIHSMKDLGPTWWSKMHMFGLPFSTRRVLYLDLDTVICGDISPLLGYGGDFMMLRDLGVPDLTASGVMMFRPEKTYHLFASYMADPERHQKAFVSGDGECIHALSRIKPHLLQDIFPGMVRSFKLDKDNGEPIVCYHGTPKPADTGWARA